MQQRPIDLEDGNAPDPEGPAGEHRGAQLVAGSPVREDTQDLGAFQADVVRDRCERIAVGHVDTVGEVGPQTRVAPRRTESEPLRMLTHQVSVEGRRTQTRTAHDEPVRCGRLGDLLELDQLVERHRQCDGDPEHVDAPERDRMPGVGEPLDAQHRERRARRGDVVMEREHIGIVGQEASRTIVSALGPVVPPSGTVRPSLPEGPWAYVPGAGGGGAESRIESLRPGVHPMPRELRTFQPLEGSAGALAAAFISDPGTWLPNATPDTTGGWIFAVHAGSLARRVRAVVGQPWHVTRTSWRSVSWEPVTVSDDQTSVNRMLPPLDGELGIHVDESGRATLVLDARYLPPGGLLGAAVDVVALHRLARQTGQRFLEDVGFGLSRISSQRDAPEHAGTSPRD
jgi:hypothetical protein